MNFDDNIFDKIVTNLNKLINSYVYKVEFYYREDLRQELLLGIYKVTKKFKIDNNIITDEELVIPESNSNVINFNKRYGKDLYISKNNYIYLKKELTLFCNENQFIRYITKTFENIYIDFVMSNFYISDKISIKFDEKNYFINEELIDLKKYSNDLISNITEEDLNFFRLFILDNKIITEREVGIKLGISQQAVNKRKKAILKKYRL